MLANDRPGLWNSYTLLLILIVFHGELVEGRCYICRCMSLPFEVHRTFVTPWIHLL